jgi:hypothetical protein
MVRGGRRRHNGTQGEQECDNQQPCRLNRKL